MPRRFLVLPQIELQSDPDGQFAEIQLLEVRIRYRSRTGLPEDTACQHLIHDYQLVDEIQAVHNAH